MALFKYQAVDSAGELLKGEMEAPNQTIVLNKLHAQGLLPISAE